MKFITIFNQDLQKLSDDINAWLSMKRYVVKNSQLTAIPEKRENITEGKSYSHLFIMSIFYEEL